MFQPFSNDFFCLCNPYQYYYLLKLACNVITFIRLLWEGSAYTCISVALSTHAQCTITQTYYHEQQLRDRERGRAGWVLSAAQTSEKCSM